MLTPCPIQIERLAHGHDLDIPKQATQGSAGLDLRAAIDHALTLQPGERSLIPCGFKMALPSGHEAQIRPRSGLALKHGITVLNAPGTIDSDYRGELKVILINHGTEAFTVERGMRIAQMVIAPYTRVNLMAVESLTDQMVNERNTQGFGSTGTQ